MDDLNQLARVRNARGEAMEVSSVSATEAKNELGQLVDRVGRGEMVVITRHERPRAVLLSVEDFNALARSAEPDLQGLSAEFDAMLERMQMPSGRKALKSAFATPPAELGKIAQRFARKRG
ncbi:MAG: type II toxin-antitoxin system Phd/YefM family antitoxin [Candidatus Xenobia bacterium]